MSNLDREDFVTEIGDDFTHGKQWEAIDNHLAEMSWINQPISSSPANSTHHIQSSCVPRVHPTHNPHYRRSEGDLAGKTIDANQLIQPPQSAPVLPEGCEPRWANPPSVPIQTRNYVIGPKIVKPQLNKNKVLVNGQQPTSFQNVKLGSSPSGLMSLGDLSGSPGTYLPDHANSRGSTSGHSSGNSSPLVARQVSSPSLGSLVHNTPLHAQFGHHKLSEEQNVLSDLQHSTSAYNLRPGSSKQPDIHIVYQKSPSQRRRSMPLKNDTLYDAKLNMRRALSQHANLQQLSTIPQFQTHDNFVGTVLPETLENVQESEVEIGKNDDKEYTIALLQHQEDRMNRLQTELETKKRELSSLMVEMQDLETKLMERNTRTSTTLQLDVGRLREVNRQLEIDCNCMHKEVELFNRDGDNTRDNFYERYHHRPSVKPPGKRKIGSKIPDYKDLPPPPVPPPQEADDEPKWRCTYCTFDNHAALNKCEICEYSRDVQSRSVRL